MRGPCSPPPHLAEGDVSGVHLAEAAKPGIRPGRWHVSELGAGLHFPGQGRAPPPAGLLKPLTAPHPLCEALGLTLTSG